MSKVALHTRRAKLAAHLQRFRRDLDPEQGDAHVDPLAGLAAQAAHLPSALVGNAPLVKDCCMSARE